VGGGRGVGQASREGRGSCRMEFCPPTPDLGPMFVFTRDDPETAAPGFTFLNGEIGAAVKTAKEAAGHKYVFILGPATAKKVLDAWLARRDARPRSTHPSGRRIPPVRSSGRHRRQARRDRRGPAGDQLVGRACGPECRAGQSLAGLPKDTVRATPGLLVVKVSPHAPRTWDRPSARALRRHSVRRLRARFATRAASPPPGSAPRRAPA